MTRLLEWRAGDLAHLEPTRGRGTPATARDPVRLRPGRTADRRGARPARLHLRRDQPAAHRGGGPARPRRPGAVRRGLQHRASRARPCRARPPGHRGQQRSAGQPADRRTGQGAQPQPGLRGPDAERRGDRPDPVDQPEGPGRPRAARAGGPDGALLAPPVRAQRRRGGGGRPGSARSGAGSRSAARSVALDQAARSHGSLSPAG